MIIFIEHRKFHTKAAQKFWENVKRKEISTRKDMQESIVWVERFITEKELIDGKCPDHGTVPEDRDEENYFFKLTNYKEELLEWLENNPDVLKPKQKRGELKKIIEEIEDISISRLKENLPWGIEVPNDPEQVLYVWFDALTNYVNVIGFGSDEKKLNEWWPGVQIFGPDNLGFKVQYGKECCLLQG